MKKMNWKDIAESVGIAAIVASLIFVGMQLRQSQEIAVADQYQDRASATFEYYVSQIQSDQALSTRGQLITDAASFGTLPVAIQNQIETEVPESVAVRYLLFRAHMTMLDNCYFQYESGFMTCDSWLAFRRRFRDKLSDDVFTAM